MGGRADRCGEARRHRYHEGHAEGEGVVAEAQCRIIYNRIEHGSRGGVADELGDEGAHEAHRRHHQYGIVATDAEDAVGKHLRQACLLNRRAQHHRAGEHHEDVPVDALKGLRHRAAAEQHHDEGGEEGCLEKGHHLERREQYHAYHDECREQRLLADVGDVARLEEMQLALHVVADVLGRGRALQKHGVACLQHYLARALLHALSATGNSHQSEVLMLGESRLAPALAYGLAAEADVGRLQLAVLVHLVDREHMMVGIHQPVRLLQLQYVVYLSRIDEPVAAKHKLVGGHRRDDLLVEAHYLDEMAALHLVKACLADGLAHAAAVGGHKQLDGVVASRLEALLRRLPHGQQTAHEYHREHSHTEAEEARHHRREDVHRRACLLGIHSRYNHVRRCSYQGADAAHSRGIAQGDEQFRGRDVQLLAPHLDHIHEECHHRGVVEERTEHSHRNHQADNGLPVGPGRTQQMLRYPLQHTRVNQSGNDDEQGSDDHHRRVAEARRGLLGIEGARDQQHGYGSEECRLGWHLGEQQHGKHRENRHYRNPCIQAKA